MVATLGCLKMETQNKCLVSSCFPFKPTSKMVVPQKGSTHLAPTLPTCRHLCLERLLQGLSWWIPSGEVAASLDEIFAGAHLLGPRKLGTNRGETQRPQGPFAVGKCVCVITAVMFICKKQVHHGHLRPRSLQLADYFSHHEHGPSPPLLIMEGWTPQVSQVAQPHENRKTMANDDNCHGILRFAADFSW